MGYERVISVGLHHWNVGCQFDLFGFSMNADETKRCAKCWQYLPITEFGHDGRTRDNLTYRCNTCRTRPTKET